MIQQKTKLTRIQSELLTINMQLETKAQSSRQKREASRKLTVRRAIEQHLEHKRLQQELGFDWWED